jgi:xanthine dehydrogenase accessory factor
MDWYLAGIEDDMRSRMFAAMDAYEPFALATIVAAEGGGPRGLGAQMVVTAEDMGGFLSGGCIEADVALHARKVLASGDPVHLVYGRGSPFVDTRLPCGGRLELQVERFLPDDRVLPDLRRAMHERRLVTLISVDGDRRLIEGDAPHTNRLRAYPPRQQLIVIGSDPFAMAIADEGLRQDWDVVVARPKGPETPPPLAVRYLKTSPAEALGELTCDDWTAIAIATHDADIDHEAIKAALGTDAGYVGVLGSRRRLPDRLDHLRKDGLSDAALDRLNAPIGLRIGARSPREVAVSVIGEIIGFRQ